MIAQVKAVYEDEEGRYEVIPEIITDYILHKDEKSYYNSYKLRNIETANELSNLYKISYLELEKLREQARKLK